MVHIIHFVYRKHVAVRIQRDLGDFKLKINMGLGAFFGDQQVHGMYVRTYVYHMYNNFIQCVYLAETVLLFMQIT